MLFELLSLFHFVLEQELAMLAELKSEDTPALILHQHWVRSDHANFGLFGYTTFGRWLLLGSFILLGRVRVFIIRTLVHDSESELDFFRLQV